MLRFVLGMTKMDRNRNQYCTPWTAKGRSKRGELDLGSGHTFKRMLKARLPVNKRMGMSKRREDILIF